MKLFTVETTAKEFHGCKDVTFHCFYAGSRTTRRPYERLIEHYDPSEEKTDAEGYIDELFTAVEAAELKSYLDCEHGNHSVTTIKPAELPIPRSSIGVGAVPVGGATDFLQLCNEQGYSLPFPVWGYFDLRACESSAGVRMQTNDEATAMARKDFLF